MFVCVMIWFLLFCYSNLRRKTGRFELASTITLVLQANRLTKCANHPTIKRIIVSFPFNIWFISFSLYYFFNSKLFLICFLQFIFVKRSNNFFTFQITNNICPWNSVFNIDESQKLLQTNLDHCVLQKYFIWLPIRSFEIFWNALVIVITFLSFKGMTQAHLL